MAARADAELAEATSLCLGHPHQLPAFPQRHAAAGRLCRCDHLSQCSVSPPGVVLQSEQVRTRASRQSRREVRTGNPGQRRWLTYVACAAFYAFIFDVVPRFVLQHAIRRDAPSICATRSSSPSSLPRGFCTIGSTGISGRCAPTPSCEPTCSSETRRGDFLIFAVAQKSQTQKAQRKAHKAHREEKPACISFSVISVSCSLWPLCWKLSVAAAPGCTTISEFHRGNRFCLPQKGRW